MLSAELRGKLPGCIQILEDVLTSYVFSFLQYSSRSLFLGGFLKDVEIRVSDGELKAAEFRFWPTFADGTEPDVVIVVGDYYVLFEAKLFASFDPGDGFTQPQVVREIEGGMEEAVREGKQFHFVAVTADSCFPGESLGCYPQHASVMRWVNWQSIARLVLTQIEEHGAALPDGEYARDLLAILDARNLRGYRGFDVIDMPAITRPPEALFLSAQTLAYRGEFLGFGATLGGLPAVEPVDSPIFFSNVLFANLTGPSAPPAHIFFLEGADPCRTSQNRPRTHSSSSRNSFSRPPT